MDIYLASPQAVPCISKSNIGGKVHFNMYMTGFRDIFHVYLILFNN
jgi:hypothetical protein